jgi:hypothetical protein
MIRARSGADARLVLREGWRVTEDGAGGGRTWPGPLAPGGSALTWAGRALPLLLGMIVLGAFVAGSALGWWGTRDGLGFWLPFWLWATSAALAVAGIAVQATQDVREARRGYTTVYGSHRDLPQIDPATRRVVREPGAPFVRAPRRPAGWRVRDRAE